MDDPSRELFGRERELSALLAALRDAEGGRGSLLVLVGEPGIGKTRLGSVFGDQAAARGAQVTWGRAWEAGGAPAYWPWIEALRPLSRELQPGVLAEYGDRLAPLGRLLPEFATTPVAAHADPAVEGFRLSDALATFLTLLSGQRPLVVVLDDLHAADAGTLELLHFVARGARAARIVVVVTYRDVEARLSPGVGEALARVAREGRYLALGRLARDDVARWASAEGRDDAAQLFAMTEGNPLFVAELLRFGRHLTSSRSGLPHGVQQVISARLLRLSPEARMLLDTASLFGRTVDLGLAAGLAGIALPRARDLAEEACHFDVLVPDGDYPSFSHILIREVLYQELSAARRAQWHAELGRIIVERDSPTREASLAEGVHHLFAAIPLLPVDEAIGWAREAATRAARRLAFEEAATLLQRVVALLPPARDQERCDLLLELALAEASAGQAARGRESAVAAAALARSAGDADRLARAALRSGAVFRLAVVDDVLVGMLREALAALPPGDHPLRARVLARLAAALQPAPDPAAPIALARDALAMAARIGDDATRLEVLVSATSALAYFGDPAERLALDSEICDRARRLGDPVAVLRGLLRLVFDQLELGDWASADRNIAEYERLSLAVNLPALHWRAPMLRAMRAVMDGRYEESEAHCAEAELIARPLDDVGAEVSLALHRAGRLSAAGRVEELSSCLPQTCALIGQLGDPIFARAFRVGMLARTGRVADALVDYDALVRHEPPLRGRPMMVWVADACLALNDARAAPLIADLLRPLADRRHSWANAGMVIEAPIGTWVDRLDALARATAQSARARKVSSSSLPFDLELEGEVWTIRADVTFRLPDSRGLRILHELTRAPGREFHVTQLLAPLGESGHVEDAGEAIDAEAITAYKQRLEDLRDAELEASTHGDSTRAARARDEMAAIARELARDVGLGGRARKAASTTEKARVNVRQRLNGAFTRIAEHSPALAKHLRQTVRTGTFCRYDP